MLGLTKEIENKNQIEIEEFLLIKPDWFEVLSSEFTKQYFIKVFLK